MKFRPIKNEAEINAAHRIELLSYPREAAASLEAFYYRLQKFGSYFLAAVEDNEIVGIINGVRTDEDDLSDERLKTEAPDQENGKYFCVLTVAVHPDFRHKGIARNLVRQLIDQASEDRLEGVLLMCEQHLIPFYQSFGFRLLGASASAHAGIQWYEMRLRL